MPMTRGWAAPRGALGAVGCSRVDLAAERAAILATDRPWQEAIATKDVEKSLSFWAEDAVVMPPAQPAVVNEL